MQGVTAAPNGFQPPQPFQRPAPERMAPVPADLMSSVRIWKRGKAWNRDGTAKILPWAAVEVTDCDHNVVLHQEDDLGDATDPEALANAIWTRIHQSARARNDGIPHHYMTTCVFADAEGRQSKLSWEGSLLLPVEAQTWGSGPGAAMSRFGGNTFLSRRDFQEASRERDRIELMGVGLSMMQSAQSAMLLMHQESRTELQSLRSERVEFLNMWRGMMEDKRAQDREDAWDQKKFALLNGLLGRLGHLAAPLGVSVTKWLGHKLGMIQPRTPREEKSFATLRRLVECAQGKIKEKALAGFQAAGMSLAEASAASSKLADDPEALMHALSEMGVAEDDPVIDDLVDLLMEMRMEMQTDKAARLAAREAMLKPTVEAEPTETPATAPEKDDP